MGIPIENIYYLLCYAWNKLDEKSQVDVSIDDKTTLIDLLAKVLINGTKILLKRGIDKIYIDQTSELAGIRGKLLVGETIKGNLLLKQRSVCTYDEYSSDTILNQLLIGTLSRLLRIKNLNSELRGKVKQLLWMFPDVTTIEIKPFHFNGLRLNRNTRFYGFLVNVCELIHNSSLPSEEEGEWKFMDFTRDEAKMNQLFEAFISNFYQIAQSVYKVRGETIKWQFEAEQEAHLQFLPQMHTDITLESKTEKIIIDAKYYKETMSERYGSEKIKSANLYQVFSYLMNQKKEDERSEMATGMLIYPTIHADYNLSYTFLKHAIHIKTIDLNMHWKEIEQRLLSIIS